MNSPLPVIVVSLTTPAEVLTNPCASLWLYLYILYYLTYCASYNKKYILCNNSQYRLCILYPTFYNYCNFFLLLRRH